MNMKTLLFSIFLALMAIAAQGQDKIYKTDGTVIDAKVKTVGDKSVTYNRFDNQGGPEYTMLKREIAKIVYENGSMDNFEGFDKATTKGYKGQRPVKKYGDNILSITPVAYTASADATINDVGIGACYERFLDKRDRISINLPVMLFFSSSKDYNGNIISYNYSNYTYSGNYQSVYLMPGVKFYPARYNEKVRYALGFSFFCIFGGEPYGYYDPNNMYNQNAPTGTHVYSMYGLMFSNSVNICATKHLYMALDLGAGMPVKDNRVTGGDGIGIPIPFVQLGFKVGYRY